MRVIDTPTWFGDGDHPLFGWLTRPEDGRVRAGVVLANSVGYEARAGRVALAALARALAEAGFACLRFDYRGTGDASGDFDTSLADRDWLEDIGTAVGYLREAGADAVTLIGMRLGAPLVSEAVQRGHADVANLVLWDPCATGRSGLRELGMLPALRREGPAEGGDESVETAEFLFSAPQAAALNSMKTSFPSSVKRCLVITRRARPLLKAFQGPVSEGSCDAITTDEQEALLEVLPFDLTIPRATIASMVEWVVAASPSSDVATSFTVVSDATWVDGGGSTPIRETARFVGEREVVVVTTEPVTAPSGPWVVMIANVHDDHIGPSRVWVEMSRQWARDGLRCARVDVAGLGESTRHLSRSEVEVFDARWMDDIRQIVALSRGPHECRLRRILSLRGDRDGDGPRVPRARRVRDQPSHGSQLQSRALRLPGLAIAGGERPRAHDEVDLHGTPADDRDRVGGHPTRAVAWSAPGRPRSNGPRRVQGPGARE